ncbi:MAG: hypothetical protein GF317_02875, partial [Candidatus Lokiarchaeota archaeon]|nr:hypothetical protein [Candidatus Lokiarchaeota archaeon]MBD3198850.1 hypothetical protein [Candidatus Lokiarchaeota archaeon]
MQRNKSITKRRIFIEDFIDKFNNVPQFDIREEFKASFSLNLKKSSQKLTPILKLANVEDAPIISDIYRTVYNDCYPFKNFEDARHLKDLMKSNQYKWIL